MDKTFKLSMILTLALLASCAPKSDTPAPGEEKLAGNIVGGTASSHDFQKENGVVALVIRTDDGDDICSGTLISKRIVLTAAHCLETGSSIKGIAVVFSREVEKVEPHNTRYVIQSQAHKGFGLPESPQDSMNDIALLKLNQDAPAHVQPARLPSVVTKVVTPGTLLIQAGFGKTIDQRNEASDTSGTLKHAENIEVLSLSRDKKELHLKEENQGSCTGDSGGPAFVKTSTGKLIQVGLNSRGTDRNSCIGVGIYTNVTAHLEWIRKNSLALMASNK